MGFSTGGARDDQNYGDGDQQGASKSHQDSVQQRQRPVQRPLLVRERRRPLDNQIQFTPSQVPG